MAHTGTAQSSRALLCALLLLLSSITGAQVLVTDSEEELSPRALRDFYPKGPNLTSEKQLVRFAPGTSGSELSKKFWKSFRLNVCQCGKGSTAKSRRVMSGSSAP
ncbi:cocaine- and amphetamine-regulated transcript protein-like isoform X2 [Takifugu rubripes]|uniref:cocaine- and amphetamine-regulated transcript protein-like isoform X2 n=1 Tax=Takifugu rubripes TaxID=31033 RepID=UPI001145FCA0|nr:uncharacterized protein LOC101080060 isoform X2 [Takifugu rubripes]